MHEREGEREKENIRSKKMIASIQKEKGACIKQVRVRISG